MATLLVVSHSRTGGTASLREAFVAGAGNDLIEGVIVESVDALTADASAVRRADGVALMTPANFGYMSGALKHFFDETYYEVLGERPGLPYVLVVKGGSDGTGAVRAVEALTTGLEWKAFRPPLVVLGELTDQHRDAAWGLGASFAATLAPD